MVCRRVKFDSPTVFGEAKSVSDFGKEVYLVDGGREMSLGAAGCVERRVLCRAGYHRTCVKFVKESIAKYRCNVAGSTSLGRRVPPFTLALVVFISVLSMVKATARPSDLEAPQLLKSGGGAELLQLKSIDPKIAKGTEFSTMLQAYVRDVAEERSVTECRLWIDVARHKSLSRHGSGKPKGQGDSWDAEKWRPEDLLSQYGGKCATVNEEFGAEASGAGSHDVFTPNSYTCTQAPWYAEAKVDRVIKGDGDRSDFTTLQLRFKQSVIQKAGDRIPAVITVGPREKTFIGDASTDVELEALDVKEGDRVTLLCLARGMQMQIIKDVQEPHYGKFPACWRHEGLKFACFVRNRYLSRCCDVFYDFECLRPTFTWY